MFKHAFIVANLALLGLVSAKKDSDFVFRAKFDPEHADNVEDASWNCIVELGDANPEQICEWKVIDKNIDQLTKLCSLGDKLMFDTLLYNYCKQKEISKYPFQILHKDNTSLTCSQKKMASLSILGSALISKNQRLQSLRLSCPPSLPRSSLL